MTAALSVDPFAALAEALGRRLRIGSLCSGMGGLDLAVEEVTGGELAWVCDNDPGARQILAHRFPGVPNLGDLTRMREPVDAHKVGELFDLASPWSTVAPVDILAAGYPCQPFSAAGRRRGLDDHRHIWPDVVRAIRHLWPEFVIFENVRGHLALGLDVVLADLDYLGYDVRWTVVTASAVGAPHRRARVFILGRIRGSVRRRVGRRGGIHRDSDLGRLASGAATGDHDGQGTGRVAADASGVRRDAGAGPGGSAAAAGVVDVAARGRASGETHPATAADAPRESGGGEDRARAAGHDGRRAEDAEQAGRAVVAEHAGPGGRSDREDARGEPAGTGSGRGGESAVGGAAGGLVVAGGRDGRGSDGVPAPAVGCDGEWADLSGTGSACGGDGGWPLADARGEAVGLGTGLREGGSGSVGWGRPDDGRVPGDADTDDPRREGAESAGRRLVPAGGGRADDPLGSGSPADAEGERGTEGLTESARVERRPHADERDPAAPRGGDASPADTGRGGVQRWADGPGVGGETRPRDGEGIQRERRRHAAGGRGAVPPDTGSERRDRGQDSDRARGDEAERDEARGHPRGGGVAAATAAPNRDGRSLERVKGDRGRSEGAPRHEPDRRPHQEPGGPVDDYDRRFGPYAAAVRRWSTLLGRRAPDPTEAGTKGGRRLNPAFVEHMMGLPAGWVTAPAVWIGFRGNARNAQLKALGNGVVPRQAALALRILTLWHVAAVSSDESEVDPPSREEVLA